ncbi:hypothetical protein L1987_59979 [Smallanthus sonchifolius]|uniref:Uncharacterized protein n=1 Tax=Smallanthus sonchifolius TaxID=185202 RepID=A0ACB9D6S6_9ASTR|nr:hypothetical protein L1987_59979 [Smallanthus sonchifolius]
MSKLLPTLQSLHEVGICLLDKPVIDADGESGRVLSTLGDIQSELKKVADIYNLCPAKSGGLSFWIFNEASHQKESANQTTTSGCHRNGCGNSNWLQSRPFL